MNLKHILHNKSKLIISLKGLWCDTLSYTTTVTQTVIQRCVEAVQKCRTGSLSLVVVHTSIKECVIKEIESKDRMNPDDDDHKKGS